MFMDFLIGAWILTTLVYCFWIFFLLCIALLVFGFRSSYSLEMNTYRFLKITIPFAAVPPFLEAVSHTILLPPPLAMDDIRSMGERYASFKSIAIHTLPLFASWFAILFFSACVGRTVGNAWLRNRRRTESK